jgi:hypothetical protein
MGPQKVHYGNPGHPDLPSGPPFLPGVLEPQHRQVPLAECLTGLQYDDDDVAEALELPLGT